jgi:DNA (cytosine-5)-methyltransferase 1
MRELHLFAGAGGGILGGMLLGHTCVCAVEIEPYCRKVLFSRQRDGILPKFPIWDDVKSFDGKPWRGKVDVVCGGFPCQDISIANQSASAGSGIDGSRSGLWRHMARVVDEVRPSCAFVENSPMLVGRGLARVVGDFAQMGYDSQWCCIGGYATGNCSNGERLWLFAYEANGKRQLAPKISARITNPEWASRRQFERAISACASANTHAIGLRDSYAMARRMDRIKAIGNGQDPRVVKLAWETLMP